MGNYLTVWGEGKININTASEEVLLAVPGLYTKEVGKILSFRRGADGVPGTKDDGVFKTIEELINIFNHCRPKGDLSFQGHTPHFCKGKCADSPLS